MSAGMPTGSPPTAPSGPPPTWAPTSRKPRTGWIIALVAGVIILPVALCAVLAIGIGGFAAFWTTHQIAATSASTQTFAVTGEPTITIHDPAGNVEIVTGETHQVVVQATRRANDVSQTQAQNALNSISVTSTQNGNTINIEGKIDSSHSLTQQRIDLLVTVPQHSGFDATVAAGTLRITGVTGVIRSTVAAGDVTLRDVTVMGTSTVSVPVGNLHFDGALGAGAAFDVTVGTGNADIQLPRASATKVDASVGVGNITVRDWPATVNRSGTGATTSFYIVLAPQNTLTAHVGTGNLTFGQH